MSWLIWSIFLRPGIPNVNIMVREVFDIGVPRQKPEKFADDALEEDFSRGHQRKTFRQVKTQLRPKDAFGPGSRTVSPNDAMIEDVLQKIEVLSHTATFNGCFYSQLRMQDDRPGVGLGQEVAAAIGFIEQNHAVTGRFGCPAAEGHFQQAGFGGD